VAVPPDWVVRETEGVVGGSDYPPMANLADKAHQQDGIVTWAHFPDPAGELVVDIALQKIDAVDIFTWQDAFSAGPTLPDGSNGPSRAEFWYKFLNTGSRLPATAGTDKMYNTQAIGSVRTYAYLGDKKLTYDEWINAVKAGRTYITTGPQLSFTVDGHAIGAVLRPEAGDSVLLHAVVEIPHDYPADIVEIVHNGKVVAARTLNSPARNRRMLSTTSAPIKSSTTRSPV